MPKRRFVYNRDILLTKPLSPREAKKGSGDEIPRWVWAIAQRSKSRSENNQESNSRRMAALLILRNLFFISREEQSPSPTKGIACGRDLIRQPVGLPPSPKGKAYLPKSQPDKPSPLGKVPEGTEAERTQWVHEARRSVGNRKERLWSRLCEFPGSDEVPACRRRA